MARQEGKCSQHLKLFREHLEAREQRSRPKTKGQSAWKGGQVDQVSLAQFRSKLTYESMGPPTPV